MGRIKNRGVFVLCSVLIWLPLAAAQKVQAAPLVTLDDGIADAGTWLNTHLVSGTTDLVLHFSAPTPALLYYITDNLTRFAANITVTVIHGDVSEINVNAFGWSLAAQTVVIGSIDPLGEDYQLMLRTIDIKNSQLFSESTVLAEYTTDIWIDDTLWALLNNADPRPPEAPTIVAPRSMIGSATTTEGAATVMIGAETVRSRSRMAVTQLPEAPVEDQEPDSPPVDDTAPADSTISIGKRVLAMGGNLLFGLGSYLMGDRAGGLFVSAGYVFAGSLFLWDFYGLNYDSKDTVKYKIAGIPALAGAGIAGFVTVFGLFRPLLYQKEFVDGDFSSGLRIGMAALNPLLGAGSYIMGDWLGGLIQSIGYETALGLVAWDVSGIYYKTEKDPRYKMAGNPGIIGMSVAGATLVFGIIRPFFYHKSNSWNKAAGVLKGLDIALIPNTGGAAVRLGYRVAF
jgi:hypothetical protein